MKKRTSLLLSVALALSIFFTYWNSLNGDFLYDDEFLIQKNLVVQNINLLPKALSTSTTYGSGGTDSFYRPIQIFSYGIIHHLFGMNPIAFHLFNVLIHITNALLIFILCLNLFKMSKSRDYRQLAFFSALIWGLHPIQTEAVAYISASADPLHFLFGLLFLIFSMKDSLKNKALGLVFLIFALLSKEASVTFPALLLSLLLFKRWTSQMGLSMKAIAFNTLPSFGLAFAYALLRSGPLDFDESFKFYADQNLYTDSVLVRAWTALAALGDYLKLWMWPGHLQIDRNFPVFSELHNHKVLFGLFLAVTCLILLTQARKRPLIALLVLWFWAYHSLHTGVALPLNSMFLEHWMYIPSLALSIGCLWALKSLSFKLRSYSMPVFIALAVGCGLSLSLLTIRQNRVWSSPIKLYNHILIGSPNIARVHNNLAMAYSDRGETGLAEIHYLKSIELQDTYPQVRHNLGLLYLRKGLIDLGLKHLKKAIEIDPGFYHSYLYLEKTYEWLGDSKNQAIAHQKWLEHRPEVLPQRSQSTEKK